MTFTAAALLMLALATPSEPAPSAAAAREGAAPAVDLAAQPPGPMTPAGGHLCRTPPLVCELCGYCWQECDSIEPDWCTTCPEACRD